MIKKISIFFSFLFILASHNEVTASSCTYTRPTAIVGADTFEFTMVSSCTLPIPPVPCCTTPSVNSIAQDIFNKYRRQFIMRDFYRCPVETHYKKTTKEMREVWNMGTAAMGAFIDASTFNRTLNDMQALTAQTLQNYTPSEQICRIGSVSKSLAASNTKADMSGLVLGELGVDKNLGTSTTISASGKGQEFQSRLIAFGSKFCDLKDNKSGLSNVCQLTPALKDKDYNRDIDFARLFGMSKSISADFTDASMSHEEMNIVNMVHFLYGHYIPNKRFSSNELNDSEGAMSQYMEFRSVAARRLAAQNSFNIMVSERLAGSGISENYMRDIVKSIGLTDAGDLDVFLGDKDTESAAVKSSYNAQMNLLSKQIYQDSAFYANLMDSKTNVKRTSAALQGVGLMQGRDIYRSMARSEMLLALLVEMEARKVSQNIKAIVEK
jgi:hypothetical protein